MKPYVALLAALLSLSLAQQASAAAKASDVDPARDRIGQIVYPLGVHPPKDSGPKGIPAHDKVPKKHIKQPAAPVEKDGGQ